MLYCIQFFVYASTFSQMVIAALPDAETAGIISTLMFAMCLMFNGYVTFLFSKISDSLLALPTLTPPFLPPVISI